MPHTNNFLCGIIENSLEPQFRATIKLSSVSKYLRLRKLAFQRIGELSVVNIQEILRSASICAHPMFGFDEDETGGTGVSVISDLNDKEMYVVYGPPCKYEYECVPLKLD